MKPNLKTISMVRFMADVIASYLFVTILGACCCIKVLVRKLLCCDQRKEEINLKWLLMSLLKMYLHEKYKIKKLNSIRILFEKPLR